MPVLYVAILIKDNAPEPRSGELVELLLEHGADPNSRDGIGLTALYVASKRGVPSVVIAMLLRHGADVYTKDPNGRGVLHHLARHKGSVAAAQKLLSRGLDPNARNNEGITPLIFVSGLSAHIELMRLLL